MRQLIAVLLVWLFCALPVLGQGHRIYTEQVGNANGFVPLSIAPTAPLNGDVYYDRTLNQFRFRQNGAWIDFVAPPPSGLNPIGASNRVVGVNNAGNALEYKNATSANSTVAITHSANVIDFAALSNQTSYSDTSTTTLTASSTTQHFARNTSGDKPFTLPLASTCPGKILMFFLISTSGFCHIDRQGSDTLHGGAIQNYIDRDHPLILISDGVSRWLPIDRVSGANSNLPEDTVSPYYEILPHTVNTGTSVSLTASSKAFQFFTSGSSTTVTLPTTSSVNPNSKLFFLKRSGAGNVTVNRASSNTIRYKSGDSKTSFTLPNDGAWALLQIDYTNSRWYVIDGSGDVLSQFGYTSTVNRLDFNAISTNAASYTIAATDGFVTSFSGNTTLTLPATVTVGEIRIVANFTGGNVTLNAGGANNILRGGVTATSTTLAFGDTVVLIGGSALWIAIANERFGVLGTDRGGTGSTTFPSSGYVVATAANTYAGRTMQQGNGIKVSNGSGVAGDTTITAGLAVTSHTGAGTAIYGLNLVTATSAGYTLDLPTAVGHAGEKIVIKRTDNNPSNVIVLDPFGSETIDDSATVNLITQYQSFTLVSDNANWIIE